MTHTRTIKDRISVNQSINNTNPSGGQRTDPSSRPSSSQWSPWSNPQDPVVWCRGQNRASEAQIGESQAIDNSLVGSGSGGGDKDPEMVTAFYVMGAGGVGGWTGNKRRKQIFMRTRTFPSKNKITEERDEK